MHDESPPSPLHLTAEIRSALEALLGRHSAAQSLVRRARIVLMSAGGASAARIGVALGCSERVVRKCRARFRSNPRLASLADRPRSGRPARVAVATRCRLVQLMAFMEDLARRYPTGPVTVIWDNLNIHHEGTATRWSSFNERHGGRFTFVHALIHASWLNQVEIWFGIVERRLLRYGEFRTIESIRQRILGFVERWNQVEGHPFRWTWRTDRLHTQTRRAA